MVEGAIRLVHPFPSILDGAVVGLVALVAGADTGTAVRLGASMTALQFAIGGLNDLVDAPVDRIGKPDKPIPAGLVSVQGARGIVVAAALTGLALALASGLPLALLAGVVLAIGAWYDLRVKGTTLSWLPFAVGIPLLPVFGWYGAAGSLPGVFLVLVPAAANAGTALAIANAIVDVERDEAAGIESIAIALGLRRSAWLVLGLQGVVALLALSTAAVVGCADGLGGRRAPHRLRAARRSADRAGRDRPGPGTGLARARVGGPGGRRRPARGGLAGRAERGLGRLDARLRDPPRWPAGVPDARVVRRCAPGGPGRPLTEVPLTGSWTGSLLFVTGPATRGFLVD